MRVTDRPKDSAVSVLTSQLRTLAHSRGPGAKLPTAREMLTEYRTSRSTLIDALDDLETLHVIHRRPGSGLYVSPKLHRKNIAIVFESTELQREDASPFWGLMLGSLATAVQRRTQLFDHDYTFHVVPKNENSMDPSHDDVPRKLSKGLIHGLLNVGIGTSEYNRMLDKTVPHCSYAGSGYWLVTHREDLHAEAATELVSLGSRRLACWSHAVERTNVEGELVKFQEYVEQFRFAASECGLPFNPELSRFGSLAYPDVSRAADGNPRSIVNQGYQAAMETFGRSADTVPDGIYISDDMMALGALTALDDIGIVPGRDVHIIATANAGSPILYGRDRRLTLFKVDTELIVREMFEMLDLQLDNKEPAEQIRYFRPQLVRPRRVGAS